MADINLMALGMSGSGKTCFLLGMYYEMSAGVNGYTLSITEINFTKKRKEAIIKSWKRME